jgi:hypothetical protein
LASLSAGSRSTDAEIARSHGFLIATAAVEIVALNNFAEAR